MNELEDKIKQFKDFLEIEYMQCTECNAVKEAKTLEYIINEWNEIFE